LNQSSGKGGFRPLLMGLTFALSSFVLSGRSSARCCCLGDGRRARPAVRHGVFAPGCVAFFFLALFPSYLKRLPRSGGWLARVKVVMGFVILAASLKYLASVDQVLQWGFLTRGRFLAAWIVLFASAGLYLLGLVRLEGVKADENMGLGRLLTGMIFLILALSSGRDVGGRLGWWTPSFPWGKPTPAQVGCFRWPGLDERSIPRSAGPGPQPTQLVFIDSPAMPALTAIGCAPIRWPVRKLSPALKNFVLVELFTDADDAASQANSKSSWISSPPSKTVLRDHGPRREGDAKFERSPRIPANSLPPQQRLFARRQPRPQCECRCSVVASPALLQPPL